MDIEDGISNTRNVQNKTFLLTERFCSEAILIEDSEKNCELFTGQ